MSLSAIRSSQKAPKEPIPEEAELDFRPSEECEERGRLEKEESEPEEAKELDRADCDEEEGKRAGGSLGSHSSRALC